MLGQRGGLTTAVGKQWEDYVLEHLQRQGLRLLQRNYRCRHGEIDLVMEEGPVLVFVEVRFRRSVRFGGAMESVDRRKQSKLLATAATYLQERRVDRAVRFDVAALSAGRDEPRLVWVRDAFRAG